MRNEAVTTKFMLTHETRRVNTNQGTNKGNFTVAYIQNNIIATGRRSTLAEIVYDYRGFIRNADRTVSPPHDAETLSCWIERGQVSLVLCRGILSRHQ